MSKLDLFSGHSDEYKRFRPHYPKALFSWLDKQVDNHQAAWDCATGNGQGAEGLASFFDKIYATDLSEQQVQQADANERITYSVATAEESGLTDHSVSLVTVFQALHWFDSEAFFTEAKRVLQDKGVIAIFGYHTAITGIEAVDEAYRDFNLNYLWEKQCWAMPRESLNQNYANMAFPFTPIETPEFYIHMQWNYHDYLAYLNTWSAVKTHQKKYQSNAVEAFVEPKIKDLWPDKDEKRLVKFPLVTRCGRL